MFKLQGSKCITDSFSNLILRNKIKMNKMKNNNYCVNKEGTNKTAVLQKHKVCQQFEESLIQFPYVQHIHVSIFGRTTTIVLINCRANHLFPCTLIMHSNTTHSFLNVTQLTFKFCETYVSVTSRTNVNTGR